MILGPLGPAHPWAGDPGAGLGSSSRRCVPGRGLLLLCLGHSNRGRGLVRSGASSRTRWPPTIQRGSRGGRGFPRLAIQAHDLLKVGGGRPLLEEPGRHRSPRRGRLAVLVVIFLEHQRERRPELGLVHQVERFHRHLDRQGERLVAKLDLVRLTKGLSPSGTLRVQVLPHPISYPPAVGWVNIPRSTEPTRYSA